MTTLVNALRTKDTVTQNGMETNSSSLSACVDLFFTIGSYRMKKDDPQAMMELMSKLEAAFHEDPLLTRKMIFWTRDIRGGAGEREIFRKILRYLCHVYPNYVEKNIENIPSFGRWDDLFVTFGTALEDKAMAYIEDTLLNDPDRAGLLAKWIPRSGGKVSAQKKAISNKIRKHLEMTPKEFRKFIVEKTQVVEQQMCKREFDKINYEQVPSLAMSRYTNAFNRNDAARFSNFKTALVNNEVKINAGAVYPYDIVKTLRYGDAILANEQWKALPNYMEGCVERILPVCDVSGSMESCRSGSVTPMDVSVSLGLYISERNEGAFKDAFITFSEDPKLQYLKGDLTQRFAQLSTSEWGMSTNLEAVFDLVLNQATKNSVPKEEMPTCILILSDMEFNEAMDGESTAMEMIREKYERHNYELPKIVFWNLNASGKNFPVQVQDGNTALISGFSPSILKSVIGGKAMNPQSIMLDTLISERYSVVK
jgi:hypothetical protein